VRKSKKLGCLLDSTNVRTCRIGPGRRVAARVAYHPSLDIPVHDAVQSLDSEILDDLWIPGTVFEVSSKQQITNLVQQYADKKIVLMCKSKSCRPCKAFTVTYKKFAELFEDVLFMSLIGESSLEMRDLMVGLGIRNTPTFLCFWNRAIVHRHSGISKQRMESILERGWQEVADELPEKDVGDALLGL
jgi:Thioredoxin